MGMQHCRASGLLLLLLAAAAFVTYDTQGAPVFVTGPPGVTNPGFFGSSATVITFDTIELAPGWNVPLLGGTLVGGLFADQGIIFDAENVISAVNTLYPKASYSNTLGGGNGYGGAARPISFYFVDPLTGMPGTTDAVGFFNPDTAFRFEIFGLSGASLGSAIVPDNVFAAFVDPTGISGVLLTDLTGSQFVIDNLTFNSPVAGVIPEPGTTVLVLTGLLSLALRKKRSWLRLS
ncbi:MAG: PEP-CTERM sorting domain-containing protein [Planctomycetes bacterium]|nr:PEP-CTERM sorting domain-containing protein [Planctomycetota bacterium]MBM4085708.1 PEP-CTERM sorting domain-containing protein [Planctomycetota bacterium]